MLNKRQIQKNAAFLCGVLFFASQLSAAITFDFDYRFDSFNFFAEQNRKDVLNAAGAYVGNLLGDSLAAIPASTGPGTGTQWQMSFTNPVNGVSNIVMDGEAVTENTIKIFVSGTIGLPTGIVAEARVGDVVLPGTRTDATLDQTVRFRDQLGAADSTPTDYGPWGGSIGFLNTPTPGWSFASLSETPQTGKIDFFSIAVHELVHILGFGESPAWKALFSGSNFVGTHADAVFGGPIPLDSIKFHWKEGTSSLVNGISQEVAMDPTLLVGTRKLLTDLDIAGIEDIGWQIVIPEPSSLSLLGIVVLWITAGRRRSTI